jgi:hypothetical protein
VTTTRSRSAAPRPSEAAKTIAEGFNSGKGTVSHDVDFKIVDGLTRSEWVKIGSAKAPNEAKAYAEEHFAKRSK